MAPHKRNPNGFSLVIRRNNYICLADELQSRRPTQNKMDIIERTRVATRRACLVAGLLPTLVLAPSISPAQTADTCYLNYAFYGPAGHYLIELFEVGAPYPSRQDWNLYNNRYNGSATYRSDWSYISKGRDYFIRVTNTDTHQAKQMRAFHIPSGWGSYYNASDFNWYRQ